MNEAFSNALIQALAQQRDQASNAAAELRAQLTVANAEITSLKAEASALLKKLEPTDQPAAESGS